MKVVLEEQTHLQMQEWYRSEMTGQKYLKEKNGEVLVVVELAEDVLRALLDIVGDTWDEKIRLLIVRDKHK